MSTEGPLLRGMLGLSSENITREESGFCWFPTGKRDTRLAWDYVLERHTITAVEDIRANREVIILDGRAETAKEHTPVEAKILGYNYNDYAAVAFTAPPQVQYQIGTQAFASNPALPSSFEADVIYLQANQNCWVRFGDPVNVPHYLALGVQYTYQVKTDIIFVYRDTLNGTLTVRALGNEVGV